jgi:peptidoglycan/LPS O-acetylase OafA/YrhL
LSPKIRVLREVEEIVPSTIAPVSGNTELTKPENRAFYPALDGLRAIAFLLVFLYHYSGFPWGWAGVNVFFVLSGFLITGILYDSRNDLHRVRNFYIRRFLRIFPLYYGVFLLVLLFDPFFHWRWSLQWLAWPLYIANFLPFVSSSIFSDGTNIQIAAYAWLKPANSNLIFYLGHFWSLCVEEQFYFVWPWVVFSVRSRRMLIWICAVLVAVVPALRFICQVTAPLWMIRADLLNRATPFQVDSLLLGGLIALLLRGSDRPALFRTGKLAFACVAAIVLPVLVRTIVLGFPDWQSRPIQPDWQFTWGSTFINLFAAGLVLLCVETSSLLYRVLHFEPLRWLGRISYGAYVFHDIFHQFYVAVVLGIGRQVDLIAEHATLFTSLLALACTVLISWISFRYFESLFLNMKERWTIQQEVCALKSVSID